MFTSGLTFNFTQIKVKVSYASQSDLYILKKIILTQKHHCEVSIIIAMNQHLNSNREDFFAFIFFFVLNCRKDWSKFDELTSAIPISSSGMYIPELSQCASRYQFPLKNTRLPIFCQAPWKLPKPPFFRQFPIYIVFLWVPSPKNWWTSIILTFYINFNPILSFKIK